MSGSSAATGAGVVRSQAADDRIEIRDLRLHDIAAFAVLRHRIAYEGKFVLPELGAVGLDRDEFAEQVANTLLDPLNKRILALQRGRAIGFVSAACDNTDDGKSAHLAIGIVEAYIGQGVGRMLMEALEAWARQTGVRSLDLQVTVHNERALALYRRCGFAIEERMKGGLRVDGVCVDAYRMAKILA